MIYLHRNDYPITVMCQFFGVSRSGYYDFLHRLGQLEPDAKLGQLLQEQQTRVRQSHGYRRMWLWLESQGIHRNPKTVLRIMKKYEVLAEIRRPRKWQQMGQQVHRYENLLNREFHADKPNPKWVTDISYIQTGQGVLYLSMIRDLYDNSDQGGQYTSQEYFDLTKRYGITPSMSRRGNCYDNAMAENFFSILPAYGPFFVLSAHIGRFAFGGSVHFSFQKIGIDNKKGHGVQVSGRMKLQHTILRGDCKPYPRRPYG